MPTGVYARRVKRHAVQPLNKPYRFIALTQGQITIVDAEDFDWLNQWNWQAQWNRRTNCFYAVRNISKPHKTIRMSRMILGCKKGEQGDHWNHDTLDNRRENLRKCTHAQNNKNQRIPKNNTSGFKGVHLSKGGKKWEGKIGLRGKAKHLGTFDTAEDAAKAYDRAAKKYYGEFAHLNFP